MRKFARGENGGKISAKEGEGKEKGLGLREGDSGVGEKEMRGKERWRGGGMEREGGAVSGGLAPCRF